MNEMRGRFERALIPTVFVLGLGALSCSGGAEEQDRPTPTGSISSRVPVPPGEICSALPVIGESLGRSPKEPDSPWLYKMPADSECSVPIYDNPDSLETVGYLRPGTYFFANCIATDKPTRIEVIVTDDDSLGPRGNVNVSPAAVPFFTTEGEHKLDSCPEVPHATAA